MLALRWSKELAWGESSELVGVRPVSTAEVNVCRHARVYNPGPTMVWCAVTTMSLVVSQACGCEIEGM